jgi:hypothetical protein
MGYTTDFEGGFNITPVLSQKDNEFLTKFSETRRMARRVGPEYGIEGEFYVDGTGWAGQDSDKNVINYNRPPSTQPGLWCQWIPTDDGSELVWNGGEKFYNYVEWLDYLIDKILAPRGYTLNGECQWFGEERDDVGVIIVKNNVVTTKVGKLTYG